MKNQQGFTLTELVLAMVVVGIIFTATIPKILNIYDKQQEKNEVALAISLTLNRLEEIVSQRVEECPVSHNVTVNNLHLPPNTLTTLPSLSVSIGTTEKMINNVSLSFVLPAETKARYLQTALNSGDRWIVRNGNQLTITQPITLLNSILKRMNYNVITGCYE